MLDAAKSAFLPEFLNRIDEVVTFTPLATGARGARSRAILVGRVADAWPTERADRRSRSTTRSSPVWPVTASTRSSAPGRCSATSGARSSAS